MDGGWARQGRKGDKIVMLHLLNNQAVNQMLVTGFFFSLQSTESLPFPMSAVVILVWPMPCPDWLGSRWQDFNLVKSHYA